MLLRFLIVCFLFLILPSIGLILLFISDYIVMSKWQYINYFLSVLFSISFIFKSFNATKILSGLLLFSILLLNIRDSLFVAELSLSELVIAIFSILCTCFIGVLIHCFLLEPTYDFYKKEKSNPL